MAGPWSISRSAVLEDTSRVTVDGPIMSADGRFVADCQNRNGATREERAANAAYIAAANPLAMLMLLESTWEPSACSRNECSITTKPDRMVRCADCGQVYCGPSCFRLGCGGTERPCCPECKSTKPLLHGPEGGLSWMEKCQDCGQRFVNHPGQPLQKVKD